jgi:hypothetical protein
VSLWLDSSDWVFICSHSVPRRTHSRLRLLQSLECGASVARVTCLVCCDPLNPEVSCTLGPSQEHALRGQGKVGKDERAKHGVLYITGFGTRPT